MSEKKIKINFASSVLVFGYAMLRQRQQIRPKKSVDEIDLNTSSHRLAPRQVRVLTTAHAN